MVGITLLISSILAVVLAFTINRVLSENNQAIRIPIRVDTDVSVQWIPVRQK
ncbi:MAG: hypothetical protein GTO18_02150 [Anaerolineales bacterium]|nr:hypothetical protein [Anaerolineales bacterium]